MQGLRRSGRRVKVRLHGHMPSVVAVYRSPQRALFLFWAMPSKRGRAEQQPQQIPLKERLSLVFWLKQTWVSKYGPPLLLVEHQTPNLKTINLTSESHNFRKHSDPQALEPQNPYETTSAAHL